MYKYIIIYIRIYFFNGLFIGVKLENCMVVKEFSVFLMVYVINKVLFVYYIYSIYMYICINSSYCVIIRLIRDVGKLFKYSCV